MARFTVGAVLMVTCPRCGRKGMRVEADDTRDLPCLTCSHTVPGAGVPLFAQAVKTTAAGAVA